MKAQLGKNQKWIVLPAHRTAVHEMFTRGLGAAEVTPKGAPLDVFELESGALVGVEVDDKALDEASARKGAWLEFLESSQKSTNMVRAIARATVEQAKGSKQVTDAIGRIAETVQQIAAATAEQARGTELITKSADKMRLISQHVERSSQEQAKGSRQITTSIEHISALVAQLSSSQKTQARSSEQLVASAQKMEESLRAQEAALVRLQDATKPKTA